jgi:ethanolaminephosphotransferase
MAVCYFLGRLLDEMDGKHARKTGNASVVGLLFDHGCDAFIVGFFLIIVAKILQINNPILNYLFVTNGAVQFYFATLEEYYIGGLHLPMFNGISDGSLIVFIVFFVLFLFGPGIL